MSAIPAPGHPATVPGPPTASLRSVALPAEHGGWGLLGEPLILGLMLAPSRVSLGIAVLALGAFLARHPLKLVLADRRRGTRYARTAAAERFLLAYAAAAAVGGVMAYGAPPVALVPFAVAAPMGVVQILYDSEHRGRQVAPELLGAMALASTAPAMVLSAGWPVVTALLLWALLGVKAVGSVLYVRARLRRDRGLAPGLLAPMAAHGVALAVAITAATSGHAPWLATAAFALLLFRATRGLLVPGPALKPKQLGFRELAYSIAATVLLTVGYGRGP